MNDSPVYVCKCGWNGTDPLIKEIVSKETIWNLPICPKCHKIVEKLP